MNLESVDAGNVSLGALDGDQCGVDLEDDVVEGCTEIRAVNGRMSGRLGVIEIFASSTVELDCLDVGVV